MHCKQTQRGMERLCAFNLGRMGRLRRCVWGAGGIQKERPLKVCPKGPVLYCWCNTTCHKVAG